MVRSLSRDTVDLIILDWMLPDTNGIELLHWIRGHIDWPIPVIFVTGRNPDVNTRTVDTHVSRLRNKLKLKPDTGWRLKAVYQHGYRLERAEQIK